MKTFFLIAATCAALVGCATFDSTPSATGQDFAAALDGKILWSKYYSDNYARLQNEQPFPGKAEMLKINSRMIETAELYEAGNISKSRFDSRRRDADADIESLRENIRSDRAARAAAMGANMRSQPPLTVTPIQPTYKSTIRCTSRGVYNTIQTDCN